MFWAYIVSFVIFLLLGAGLVFVSFYFGLQLGFKLRVDTAPELNVSMPSPTEAITRLLKQKREQDEIENRSYYD